MSFRLTTDRLILQVEDSSKAEQILSFYDKNSMVFDRFEPTRPEHFYTLTYQKAALQYEYSEIVKGKTLRYYIYLKNSPDTIIGSLNFSCIQHGPFSRASIGYKIDRDHQGHGYAAEACQAAIPVLFSNYKIHRIEARVSPDNIASIKLLEKLGFQFEGMEYKSVEVNGIFQDHFRYSLIAPN